MPRLVEVEGMKGVLLAELDAHHDERGTFMETFRSDWFPGTDWSILQGNRSISEAGVLRGLHFHHRQTDYWHVTAGSLKVGLFDLRPDSGSYGCGAHVIMSGDRWRGLLIPPGVAHGFYGVSAVNLIYFVNQYFTGDDEFGVAWDDPALGLTWGDIRPQISDRDASNPLLRQLTADELPT